MFPSIVISGLSASTPDGTSLFTNLNFQFGRERYGLIGRNGVGKTTLLNLITGTELPKDGKVQVAGSLGVLSQNPAAYGGQRIADVFQAGAAIDAYHCALSGHATAEMLEVIDWELPEKIEAALLKQGIAADPRMLVSDLSGGQQTRVGLAALAYMAPDILLLDEPTNNLDREGREAVLAMMAGWQGGAIIVSHDRELLDVMDVIADLTTLGISRFQGNYSAYQSYKAGMLEAAAGELAHAERNLTQQRQKAQQAAERKARKDGSGKRARSRNDQPKILADAAQGRSEASAGANAQLRHHRLEQANKAVVQARHQIEILQPVTMHIGDVDLPADKVVLTVEQLEGGYAANAPIIRNFNLKMIGPERVVLAGPNGAGKTTLLNLIAGRIPLTSGTVTHGVKFALLDQRVDMLDDKATIIENFKRLHPLADENEGRAALARFMFRGDNALKKAGVLSGGERLRAGLACVLGGSNPPALLILDEPTNHLDLDAVEALEAALSVYQGAILAVSHDRRFLEAIGPVRVQYIDG